MSKPPLWAFPDALQPKAGDAQFDLARAMDAMVMVRTTIPEDAFTAGTLGTERGGYGVVIAEDGLVLTIGYLITEATQVWLTSNRGVVVAGYPLAYDQATGLGLVQPLGKLGAPPLSFGISADAKAGDSAFALGHGGQAHSLRTRLVAKEEFAGYWEYVLDEALFTAPAHPQWGGAALLDAQGDLIGIGSLLVEQKVDDDAMQVNLFVPTDLLHPIFDSMLKTGRSQHPPRPWLGIYAQEREGAVVVGNLAPGGPAEKAGLRAGDLILNVAGHRVHELAELFRCVWKLGPAGVDVPIALGRGGEMVTKVVKSADRTDFLKKPNLQ